MANRFISTLFSSGEEFEEFLQKLDAFKKGVENGDIIIPKATLATKATQDGDGKVIKDTYAKITDLTVGDITVAKATNANHATRADRDNEANVISNTYAKTADLTSEVGIKVARASKADSATNANHATSADSATHATTAGSATNATTAGSATNADHATKATNADYATFSNYATSATNADHATKATNADSATEASSLTLNSETFDEVSTSGVNIISWFKEGRTYIIAAHFGDVAINETMILYGVQWGNGGYNHYSSPSLDGNRADVVKVSASTTNLYFVDKNDNKIKAKKVSIREI